MIVSLGVVINLVATYRSFLARRILRRPIYRSHALWTMLIGLMISILTLPILIGELTGVVVLGGFAQTQSVPFTSTPELIATYLLIVAPFFIVFWAWVDQSIGVAFDMDFLHRDTLSWKGGGRWVSWALILVQDVVGLFVPQNGQPPTMFYYALITILFAYGACVLLLSSRKVKDVAMKSYVKWVGVMTASLVLVIITYPYYAPIIIFAYALYRASGSFTMTSPLEVPQARV